MSGLQNLTCANRIWMWGRFYTSICLSRAICCHIYSFLFWYREPIWQKIEFEDQPVEFTNPNARNLVAEVSTKVRVPVGLKELKRERSVEFIRNKDLFRKSLHSDIRDFIAKSTTPTSTGSLNNFTFCFCTSKVYVDKLTWLTTFGMKSPMNRTPKWSYIHFRLTSAS